MTEDISWMTLRSTWIKQIRLREPLYYWGKLITISSTNKQELLKWNKVSEPQGRGLALPFTSLVCLFYKILMLCNTWKLYNDWLCFNFMKNKILHKTIKIEHFSLTFMKTALWLMSKKIFLEFREMPGVKNKHRFRHTHKQSTGNLLDWQDS